MRCVDASKMMIQRDSLERIPVNVESSFTINTNGSSFGEQFVSILAPGNRSLKPLVTGDPDSGFRVSFTPLEVGDHFVDVKVAGGESVPPSPFLVKVYDASNVKVSDISSGSIGKPVFFTSESPRHFFSRLTLSLSLLVTLLQSTQVVLELVTWCVSPVHPLLCLHLRAS